MKSNKEIEKFSIRDSYNRLAVLLLTLLMASLPGIVFNDAAFAAQVTSRSLLIGSAQAGVTTNYTFGFTPASTTQIQSIKILSCTTPLGTCTAPSGINLSGGTITQSGFQGATSFTKDTSTAGCTTVDVLCVTRIDNNNQTATAHSITDTGAINQDASNCSAAPNCTFFERIVTFTDAAYTTQVDYGTVASTTTQIFTVNAAIQEQLAFCIGSTVVDNAISSVSTCSSITGTSLNLGVLNSTNINISPVSVLNKGDAHNGLAIMNTNASNGATVAYDAVQQTGTNHQGTLRVAGATCNVGFSNTDQCIDAIGATKAQIVTGNENFGMTVAGVNCGSVIAYTCTFSTGTYNLIRTTNYNCDTTNNYPVADANVISGTSLCSYAWDESGTPQTIAASSIPVGNEALILKFAASPNLISPTGSYTDVADFVATPTY